MIGIELKQVKNVIWVDFGFVPVADSINYFVLNKWTESQSNCSVWVCVTFLSKKSCALINSYSFSQVLSVLS